MARARNIKPGFFKNELLAEMPAEIRLLFIGLWTLADREGRLEDRPRRIRVEICPFDQVDVDSMLNRLQSDGFLVRYEIDGTKFIEITNFVKHQDPHYREKASVIPPPPGGANRITATNITRSTRQRILERDGYKCCACGSTEHLCIDHILPASRGGDSADDNLQTLCLPCNTKKGNKLAGEDKNITRRSKPILPGPANVDSTSIQVGPLIPDSLIPDSLEKKAVSDEPAPEGRKRGRPKSPEQTFPEFVADCAAKGEEPVPATDAVFRWASDVGLPVEFLELAWVEFDRQHVEKTKRQRDWRATFRNAVRLNWYRLWWCPPEGGYALTTAGIQAQRELRAAA